MEKDAKILVAGARGLVGSALVRELRAQGYSDLLTPPSAEINLVDPVVTRWFFSVYKPTHVFFCAARVGGIADNLANKVEFFAKNMQMEMNVISNAAAYGCEKLLFVGTSCMYPKECPQPMREEYLWSGRLEPATEAYSVAKLAGAKLCEYYREEQGKNFVTAVPCNVFGPNDNFDPQTAHCLPGMMARMQAAKITRDVVFKVWGSLETRREFIYSADLAEALILVMRDYVGKEPINTGSSYEVNMGCLAELLARVIGYQGRIEGDSEKPTGATRKLMDNAKLAALGWEPRNYFYQSLEKTYEWFKLNAG